MLSHLGRSPVAATPQDPQGSCATTFPTATLATSISFKRTNVSRHRRGSRYAFRAKGSVRYGATLNRPLSEVRFLTVAEVASVMRVSKMTVYRLIHSGELPANRVGRSFRVPEQAVHDYLRDSYVEAG